MNDETESTDETTPEKRNNHFNAKSKSLSSKQKPLAYYDDIFVYDTFQWEDEFPALDLIEQEIMNNSNENIDSIIKKALSSHNANEMEQMLLKNAKSNQESNHRDITSKRVHDQSGKLNNLVIFGKVNESEPLVGTIVSLKFINVKV